MSSRIKYVKNKPLLNDPISKFLPSYGSVYYCKIFVNIIFEIIASNIGNMQILMANLNTLLFLYSILLNLTANKTSSFETVLSLLSCFTTINTNSII